MKIFHMFNSSILLVIFELFHANSLASDQFDKDSLEMTKECEHRIGKEAFDCISLVMTVRDRYENSVTDDNKFMCCSTWDVADCYLNTIKVKISRSNGYLKKFYLDQM